MRTLRLLLICFALLTSLGSPLSAQAPDFAETKKKAEAGDAQAQLSLGGMYANGRGVAKDDAEAAKWWRKAADQGRAQAQYNLGGMYNKGEGVPKDFTEAYAWFNLAATPLAQKLRDVLEKSLTPEQKVRAQQRSTELHKEIEARKKAGK